MKSILLIGLGGFFGTVMRYLVSYLMNSRIQGFPFGTLAVNISGCFAIGLLFAALARQGFNEDWKLFLTVGLCGGYTTFSAFSIETMILFRNGQVAFALLYVAGSVLVGLLATYLGVQLATPRG